MPRVAYSEAQRSQIRKDLVAVGLDLMTKQGIQHTTVEQIYQKVGISRSFFYSFFPNSLGSLSLHGSCCAPPNWTGGRPSPDFSTPAVTASKMASRC